MQQALVQGFDEWHQRETVQSLPARTRDDDQVQTSFAAVRSPCTPLLAKHQQTTISRPYLEVPHWFRDLRRWLLLRFTTPGRATALELEEEGWR